MKDELASWTGLDCASVYHVNGDRLDNRRCNLRIVAQSEYRANTLKKGTPTSRFKGVYLVNGGRWVDKIRRKVKTLKRDGRTDTGLILAYEAYGATDSAPSWTDRYPIHAFQVSTKGLALNDSANMTLRVTVDSTGPCVVFIWYRSLASVEYTPAGNQYSMRGVPL